MLVNCQDKTVMILALSAALLVPMILGPLGPAMAQQPGGAAAYGSCDCGFEHFAFDAADSNGDGLVSEGELTRDAAVGFSSLDLDRSMTLTPQEPGPHDPALFAKVDRNGDGVLTFSEVMINKTQAFEMSDDNNDDGLSFTEMVGAVRVEAGVAK